MGGLTVGSQDVTSPGRIARTIEIVTATKVPADRFALDTPLGQSLARLDFERRIFTRIFAGNSRGLPEVYNQAIDATSGAEILVFIHDDVWLEDFYVVDRLLNALATFDAVGVAGNRRRSARQLTWHLDPASGEPDTPYLSGTLGHGNAVGKVAYFGQSPAPCEIVDGLFLAMRHSTLRRLNVRFDTRFDFHFYDLDFCRTLRQAGASLGTWPIVLAHRSGGDYNSPGWRQNRDRYFAKWGD